MILNPLQKKKDGYLIGIPNLRNRIEMFTMGLIKEPKDVDFYVDPRPLTKEEQKRISDFIKSDKNKRKRRKPTKKNTYA